MTIFEAIILGLVQGLTEFIPVSSSGHLVLLHDWFNVTENALAFDVALHFGTLLALLIYFRNDVVLLARGVFGQNQYTTIARVIVVATLPAVFAGVLLESAAESAFRSSKLVAFNLIVVGCIMLFAERYAKRYQNKTKLQSISMRQGVAVGFAQAAAIIPGVSRSGATITTGLFLGVDRVAATRFSFLLGIPIMIGAVSKVMLDSDTIAQLGSEVDLFVVGIVMALVSGLFAIQFLLGFLAKHTLAVFAYYRIILGTAVLTLAILS